MGHFWHLVWWCVCMWGGGVILTPRGDVLEPAMLVSQSSWDVCCSPRVGLEIYLDTSTMDCLRFGGITFLISSLWMFIQFHFSIWDILHPNYWYISESYLRNLLTYILIYMKQKVEGPTINNFKLMNCWW